MTPRDQWPEQQGYEYTEIIPDGVTGNTVKLQPVIKKDNITCTCIAGAGTGKFQFTTSTDASVSAGTCIWIDWPKGAVTGTNYDVITGPVTAVRGVSVSGEINIEIVR